MTNKDKALHLVKQGFQVIPIAVNEDGTHNYSFPWSKTIINTEALVDTYWYGTVDRRVAVLHPTIGVIDVDVKNGKNGFEMLAEAGVSLPDTYNYETKSGGRHFIYRFPAGSTKWVPVEGVDVQVGNGIFVWYGDVISDEELANIPNAPQWAIHNTPEKPQKTATATFNAVEWFNALPKGEVSESLQRILSWDSLQYPDMDHNSLIKGQFAIIAEGAKGAVGVLEALDELKERWLFAEENTPENEADWNNGLRGLVIEKSEVIEAIIEENTDEARIEAMARDIFIRNQANALAKRMEAAKYATGVKRYTWEELEGMQVDWCVDGFLAYKTNTMLVGASNLGKTFLYIDWMGCSIAGLPWAGRETKKAKFMVVIGEGAVGWDDRLKAWCHENGQDYYEVRKSIVPMSAASLASDSDIDEMRSVAHAEQVDFIIFDTWNTNSGMSDENANAEAAMALNAAARIKGDAGVVIIHHPNAETQNTSTLKARGATAVQGKMDFVISMFQTKLEKETEMADAKYITVSTLDKNGGKSRHSERFAISGLYLKDVLNTKVMAVDATDLFGKVNAFFAEALASGPKTRKEILLWAETSKWDMSESTFKRYLKQVDNRRLKVEEGKGGIPTVYSWDATYGMGGLI